MTTFEPTEQIDVGGRTYRIVPGCKRPNDLRLDLLGPHGFRAVGMKAVFFEVDFYYRNEHNLYPPSAGYLGGDKFRLYINNAIDNGWEAAAADLDRELEAKRLREERLRNIRQIRFDFFPAA